jgi:hypothetical protein
VKSIAGDESTHFVYSPYKGCQQSVECVANLFDAAKVGSRKDSTWPAPRIAPRPMAARSPAAVAGRWSRHGLLRSVWLLRLTLGGSFD